MRVEELKLSQCYQDGHTVRKVVANGPVKADEVLNAHRAVATAVPLLIMLSTDLEISGERWIKTLTRTKGTLMVCLDAHAMPTPEHIHF